MASAIFRSIEADKADKKIVDDVPDGGFADGEAMGMYRGWSLKIWNYNHGLASMPNMQGTPSAVASVTEVNMGDDDFVKLGSQPDRFGAILTGVLPVYESGFYNFYTVSDGKF